MSTDVKWKSKTEQLLRLRGTRVVTKVQEDPNPYSQQELIEVLGSIKESVESLEGMARAVTNDLDHLRGLAGKCPTKWTEEELGEYAKDATMMDILSQLDEGYSVTGKKLNELRVGVDSAMLEASTPQVANALDKDLHQRIKALRQSESKQQIELFRLRNSTQGFFDAVNETEVEKVIRGTVDIGKLFVGGLEEEDKEVVPEPLKGNLKNIPRDDPAFLAYREVWAAFRPNLTFAERLNKYEISTEVTGGIGQQILDGYAESERLKESEDYVAAKEKLEELSEIVANSKNEIKALKNSISKEAEKYEAERKEVFTFTTKTKDGEFDTDYDAQNFFLGSVLGDTGGLEKSPRLLKMEELFDQAIKEATRLRALGALPEEIGRSAMKGIPKAFWPDWLIKEVEAFKDAHEKLEAELVNAEVNVETIDKFEETLNTGEKLVNAGTKINDALEEFNLGKESARELTGEVLKELTDKLNLLKSAYELGKQIGETIVGGEVVYDNPVKAKMVEFERNRAIIEITNKMVALGCDVLGEICPVLGIVSEGKDALMEIFKAAVYFKKLYEIGQMKKGAKLDPRSAVYLPLYQICIEKKIQASEATFNAITNTLSTLGKAAEVGVLSAPIGVAVDKAAKVIKYTGKVVISGCKWSEAEKAHKNLKLAIGPPPIRKAMLLVQKHNAKYARYILITGALDNDPWAIQYLESIGLEQIDLDNPNTTTDILREYITLTSGGLLGDKVEEEQQRFKDSAPGKLIMAVKGGAEKVRDVFIGRDTSAKYEPAWKPPKYGLSRGDWQVAKKDAIANGWYDNRLKLGDDFEAYEQAKASYDPTTMEGINKYLSVLGQLRAKVDEVWRTAKANDQTTVHAGMRAICTEWGKVIDIYISNVEKDRTKVANQKYANLSESEKQTAIANDLRIAAQEQAKIIKEKRQQRKDAITDALVKTKFKSPWGSFSFAKDMFKLAEQAKKKLGLTDRATTAFQNDLLDLSSTFLERLTGELEASPEVDFEKNLKLSLTQLVDDAYQMIRRIAEQAFEQSSSATLQWQHSPSDIVFDSKVLQSALKAAEKFDKGVKWDGSGSGKLVSAMKDVQRSIEKYDEAKGKFMLPPGGDPKAEKDRPEASYVDGRLGKLLGALDNLELELTSFDPETDRQLPHNGLIGYKFDMIDEVKVKRIELDSDGGVIAEQRLKLASVKV